MGPVKFEVRHNVLTINSFQAFIGVKGGCNHGCRDVYFIRGVGCSQTYVQDIIDMDRKLAQREQMGQGGYIRVNEFPRLCSQEDIAFYSSAFDCWEKNGKKEIVIKSAQEQSSAAFILSEAVQKILLCFRQSSAHLSQSIERNFGVKLLFWADQLAGRFLKSWNEKNGHKFVCSGTIKKQEYLFCYLLTLLGIDVLVLLPEGDIQPEAGLLKLSELWNMGGRRAAAIPSYDPAAVSRKAEGKAAGNEERKPVEIERKLPGIKVDIKSKLAERHHGSRQQAAASPGAGRQNAGELPFEELAKLASSVVMITVHDQEGEIISTGSGIMVGARGYILTNNHVASRGVFYSVRIEDDEKLYETDELIKYNPVMDLAVLRIDRNLKPIPIYSGEKPLVRGQKVVAIGSPLGLFNSVSDGIISGFRKIDQVDMIQFTAPISPGSSGGALLNLYGEVIGISTAGFDNGQNINLAVDFKCITGFIRGFV